MKREKGKNDTSGEREDMSSVGLIVAGTTKKPELDVRAPEKQNPGKTARWEKEAGRG